MPVPYVFFFFSQELSKLVGMHHEAQLLYLQLHMNELEGQTLLPILEKLEPKDRLELDLCLQMYKSCYNYN